MNKLKYTQKLIKCWVESFGVDGVYVAFSGGKDSSVLLDITRKLYPEIEGVFCNTGLEYPEIVSLVKKTSRIVVIRPKIPFHKVVKKYGWPVIGKRQARFINDLQNPTPKNHNTRNLRLTGITSTGRKAPSQKLAKKWRFLVDAPFKISEKCCHYLKHGPLEKYSKDTKTMPMIGVMKAESTMRDKIISKFGCNMYEIKNPKSYPIANWTDKDIWGYIRAENIPYASVYDNGETRTGCLFCMFGIAYDGPINRFHRLKITHPKLYDYCINKLGAGEVLDWVGVDY